MTEFGVEWNIKVSFNCPSQDERNGRVRGHLWHAGSALEPVVTLISKLTQLSDISPGGDHEKPSGWAGWWGPSLLKKWEGWGRGVCLAQVPASQIALVCSTDNRESLFAACSTLVGLGSKSSVRILWEASPSYTATACIAFEPSLAQPLSQEGWSNNVAGRIQDSPKFTFHW